MRFLFFQLLKNLYFVKQITNYLCFTFKLPDLSYELIMNIKNVLMNLFIKLIIKNRTFKIQNFE